MKYKEFIKIAGRSLLNIRGFHTKRKILVIESDDWGCIGMPSKNVFEKLKKLDLLKDHNPFIIYDSLASETDLENLFEVLTSVKDKNGKHAIITANTIMTNPDFDKIRESEFQQYFYEPFTRTLQKYPEHKNSFNLWKEGMRLGFFKPQFHGREHINIPKWMDALKNNLGNLRIAFENGMITLTHRINDHENSYLEPFKFSEIEEFEYLKSSIKEGTELFYETFGFRSKTFIAPRYVWSNLLNNVFYNYGIRGFQGAWIQLEFQHEVKKYKKIIHYTGQKNKNGQIYLIRNAYFEPSLNCQIDHISNTLCYINNAFKFNTPAIIGSHRINYIGYIDKKNSGRNLKLLLGLLKKIMILWPDVEFMSSDQLVDLICNEFSRNSD